MADPNANASGGVAEWAIGEPHNRNGVCWYGGCHEPNIIGLAPYCAGHELLYRATHDGVGSIEARSLHDLTQWEFTRANRR